MDAATLLDTPTEIAPGVFKPLRDCTRSDLKRANSVDEERMRLLGIIADACRELAMIATHDGTVSVPEWLAQDERSDVTLTTLRARTREMEALVAGLRK